MDELTFEGARERLERIIEKVKSKDIGLEESINLLEEGVRMATLCSEKLVEEASVDIEGETAAAVIFEEADSPQADASGDEDIGS